MPYLTSLATYLPVWGDDRRRTAGPDEDAVTLAVAAGRAALDGADAVSVVLVSRDVTLLEGGVEGVLLAGLDLRSDTRCTTVLGGAPAALDALAAATDGTLVIGVDVEPAAAAGAGLVGPRGASIEPATRSTRSLPVTVRDASGATYAYDDPRLLRERGVALAISRLDLDGKPLAIAGLSTKDAAGYVQGVPAALPSAGAAATLFAVATAVAEHAEGVVVAVEQAAATAARLAAGNTVVRTIAPVARPLPRRRTGADADIKISLPAYERAFDAKVRLAAGRCDRCGALHLPPRYRCTDCGSESGWSLVPLPRTASVYTAVSVHVPVPGLNTPYDLAIIELGDTGVRLLAPVADAEPGSVGIDDTGSLVLRRMALRSGIPDYGYAFVPDEVAR